MRNDLMEMRASDQDRQQVVDRLRAGLDDGRLQMEEYVERMGRAYQALTYADLVVLHADLPLAARPAPGPRLAAGQRSLLGGLPTMLKVLWTIWLTVVSINVVVWVLVSGTSGHLAYPWPVWVAGPYGALLAAISVGVLQFRRQPSV